MNKITNPMVLNRQKKKALVLRAFIVAITLALFTPIAQAQQNNVMMKDGTFTIQRNTGVINFYDSHGASRAANYWEGWYAHNEGYTYVFKPAVNGDKIKVTFLPYTAYADPTDTTSVAYQNMLNDPNNYSGVSIGQWVLRLNDDELSVYEGIGAVEANKITDFTGNGQLGFSVMSDGAITFKFTSNGQYREEGWYARVELVENSVGMSAQAPYIRRSTCSDMVEIYPTTKDAKILYSSDGNDPAPGDPLGPNTYEYDAGVGIPFPEGAIPSTGFTVTAISQLTEGGAWSSPSSATFYEADRVPIPGPAQITRTAGTNTIVMTPATKPTGLNDTYQVRYTMTTNGTEPADPTYSNSTPYSGPITATINGTIYKAKTFAVSCHDQMSATTTRYEVEGIFAATPVIDFDDMTITATEGTTVFDILYTVDGTDPAIDGTTLTGTFSNGTVDLSSLNPALTYGQTVKALAYMASDNNGTPDANYTPSQVVSAIYVPTDENGNTQNGVYGGIVLLDDREDHSWAYYSDEDNPIHSLKPADVKITYMGYGEKTMTGDNTDNMPTPYYGTNSKFDQNVNAEDVAVNVNEPGSQFIYLKTLENDDPEGAGNTYSYTMIHNPFQVRPAKEAGTVAPTITRYVRTNTITSGKRYLIVSQSNTGTGYALGHSQTTIAADAVTISSGSPANYIDPSTVDATSIWTVSGNNTYTFQNGGYYIYRAGNNNNRYLAISNSNSTSWTWNGNNNRLYYDGNTDYYIRYNNNTFSLTTSATSVYLYEETTTGGEVTGGDYRGFYAWRIKKLGSGLSITGKSVGDIIYPGETIEFVTSNAKGNEVEFEALWAKAWVNDASNRASNSGNYRNAYERNFKVGSSIANYDYPVTFTTLMPNGSGTVGSASTGTFSCSSDYKFENMALSADGLTANNHNLHVGRGVTGTITRVQGLDGAPANNGNAQYTIRLESGTYNYVSWIKGYYTSSTQSYSGSMTIGGTSNSIIGVLGCDYDRAMTNSTGNNHLTVTGPVFYGFSSLMPNQDVSKKTLDVTIKSGKFNTSLGTNMGTADAHESVYMGIAGSSTNTGERRLTVEGGILANIAGGVDAAGNDGNRTFTLRMKNGTVNGAIYGAGAVSPAYGDRCFVITGGTVKGWIGGGCNGVIGSGTTGGQTMGLSHVYVGGKTSVGGSATINGSEGGTVFGAGKGSGNSEEPESGRMAYGTNVVIADEATISNNVYGGGNYGFADEYSKLYVLGGTVQGSVFGGSNQNKGPVIDIYMKVGTINGSLYGGSNTSGTISDMVTVNVSGGTVKGSVYGGGYGSATIMSNNTNVTVTGGTINENLYGGGSEGDVSGNTRVSFEGGSVTDIFGAGKGTSSNVAQGTTVNVKGGVVNGAVYGGGENGTVASGSTSYGSTVSFSGGEVKGDVFGGGRMGTTNGPTTVNITGTQDGTILRENVFAGAYGSHGSIYVAGLKTLNIAGGRIYGSVYGGSRNANDANTFNATFDGSTETATTSVVNISGGRIDQHVYAAGYYGNTVGSVYAFIGINAINEAPNSLYSASNQFPYDKGSILIGGSVWAGGDWGVFTGAFGGPTISGNSNIYINGEGYHTEDNDQSANNYMNIHGSIFGSGTSCDAGKGQRVLNLRHYGADVANNGSDKDVNPYAYASRQVNSIQRFHNVIFDNAKLGFLGQGRINSLNTTEQYSLYEIDQNVYLANGSTMVINVPSSQIYSFHSVTCPNTYAASPTFTPVAYNGLGTNGGATDNKIRVNGGSYVEIKYIPEGAPNGVTPTPEDPEENVTVDFETGDLSQLNNTTSGISYTNDATYPWTVVSNGQTGFNGTYCMKSGNGGQANTESSITVTAVYEEAGSISFKGGFWGEGSDAQNWDKCRFYIDNEIQIDYGAHQAWENQSFAVPVGDHTFTWTYKKDNSVNPDGDAFFVDDIVFTGVHIENSGEDPQPVYYAGYGELSGYAHMMAGNPSNDATCAYARPKQSQETGNILPASASAYFNNANGNWTSLEADGGWVSYRAKDNQYDIAGNYYQDGEKDQLRYENHYPNMRDNSEYYRIWRHGGNHHHVEAVVNAHAEGTNAYKTVEVEVQLPSWGMAGSYYRFDRTNNQGTNNTLIDYGPDVMTYNGANYSTPLGDETWMYYDDNADAQVTGVTASNATVAAAIGTNGILSNPNLNFGLVMVPGLTMKSTDANYIINSEADTYLASVEKPFNCDDNLHMPTIKLVLTYSDKLSANATLEPVHIYLVQCNSEGTITDYVDLELIINTSMKLTSGFTTQIYARMDGSQNLRETSTATVVLPTFNVAESGEMAKFYLKNVEFVQNGGVVIESSHGNSVTCAETVESTGSYAVNLNIDRFAMTIGAQANPDNTDDWRDATGPQDAVQPSGTYNYNHLTWGQNNNRGVHLGDGKGRNPLSFGITLYYNSNELAEAKTKMGDMVFTIEVQNIEGGTGTNNSTTFTITVEVYRVGPGSNFYVDGINGQDLNDENRAKFPDKAAKTVNFIFNRLGYMPGDNIIVVNELPINKVTTWDGSQFQNNVKIYRYPGGHKLSAADASIVDNADNEPYMGPLVDVSSTLNMKGIMMDGMYAEATAPLNGVHNPKLYPTGDAGNCSFNGLANAPLITVSNIGRVNLTNTTLQNNNNNNTEKVNAGGAVHVTYGGILAMNVNNRIAGNYNANGGGVYVDGSMIVSDYAYVYDNYTAAVSGSGGKADAELEQNNVMLEDVNQGSFRVVQLGTSDSNDAYDALLPTDTIGGETKVGVTKDDWDHAYDGYMPVVYAEPGSLSYLNDPYNTQSMVVHDAGKFKLERYVSSEFNDSPNYLYWLETWVTAVTSEPIDFNKDQIDTPEELAWAISIVNGENGCTPAPGTSFTLTSDIDMAANIWVPIGTETSLYNGTFEGNGHVVTGLRGSITRTDMGMFGRTDTNADIKDMVVSTKFNTNSDNVGTVVGNMVGGTLSNVEGAGENTSRNTAGNNGGLVGVNGGTIHSCFAVTTIKGGANIGGLVAVNNSNLFNSYSSADLSEGAAMAGLVATNAGRVENCYDATNAEAAFAVKNSGVIRYCYAAEAGEGETITYVSGPAEGSTLEKYGTYGDVKGIKDLAYLYGDNKVTATENQTIGYVKTTHEYVGNHTVVWDGLLSVLNQWIVDDNIEGKPSGLSTWNRPLTQTLNGDLPVLAFPKDNCVGNYTTEDGKMLRYSASDEVVIENGAATQANNGLDKLLTTYANKEANIFLYGSAIEVAEVPTEKVNVFVNEDAVLMQKQQPNGTKANEADFINTTVGITFDNSCKAAHDYYGETLLYDWHLMSTPLADAKLGITYTGSNIGYGKPADWSKVENSYMPDMTNGSKEDDDPEAEEDNSVKWDFYTYYEPEYHWINFKRSKGNHWHYDEPHDNIAYNGTEQTGDNILEPGRGYMMAINQDSYLNQTGTLNNGDVEIELTLSGDQTSDTEPTKDWGSNLIGNPYQAYLDLDVVSEEFGLESFYVYDADNGTYGPYMTGASVNPAIPSQFIHPHQGFFAVIDEAYVTAHSANDGNGNGKAEYEPKSVNVTFTYEMATPDKETTSYFRGNKQPDYPVVNIFVTNERGSRDLAIIELDRPELNGVRKIENLRNTNFKVYARYEGNNYGLLFTPAGAQKVPVHFKTMEDGKFTMTWSTYNGTFTNLVLVDNLTGVRCNMLTSDHYTFEGSVDDYAARFFITFNVTDVEEINGENGDFAWFDGNEWVVTGQGQLEVIDVTGRVLQSRRVSGEQTRLHLDNVAAGVYMMRLTEGNRAKTQKIVIR